LTFGLAQIQGHALFVACDQWPPNFYAAAPIAHGVANFWDLYLNNLGAHIAHELAAKGASNECSEFEDA